MPLFAASAEQPVYAARLRVGFALSLRRFPDIFSAHDIILRRFVSFLIARSAPAWIWIAAARFYISSQPAKRLH